MVATSGRDRTGVLALESSVPTGPPAFLRWVERQRTRSTITKAMTITPSPTATTLTGR
jgi:hypothetical protein